MWPFSRKKKKETPPFTGKYAVGDDVGILTKDLFSIPGRVIRAYYDEKGTPRYDVSVGGQCPYVKSSLREVDLKPLY